MKYVIEQIKLKVRKHLPNFTYNKLEKCSRIKQTIEKPDFCDIDEIFNNYITIYNKEKLIISR